MKKLIYSFLFVFGAIVAHAQAPEYDDLKILYADGNYEKLVKVAENYSMKEDLKKDPLPFVWLAKGLYKISLSGTDDEKFKNAYKDAIAALSKAIKNDKDQTLLGDEEEFISEFQLSLAELVNNDLTAKDYNKASGWVIKYYKITRNPLCVSYIDGATKFRKADKSGANTIWKDADVKLATISVDSWSEADISIFKTGILQTAECYIASKQVDKAKTLLNKATSLFEDDEDFKAQCDELAK
jgi:tetratricopeptide (TPR) repeat protein